jgi:hypothetical protein
MQLQTVLCCAYNVIYVTSFKINNKLYVASGSAPRDAQGNILGAHLSSIEYAVLTFFKYGIFILDLHCVKAYAGLAQCHIMQTPLCAGLHRIVLTV